MRTDMTMNTNNITGLVVIGDAMKRIQNAYDQKYDYNLLKQARKKTAELLHEKLLPEKEISIVQAS
mgnify:CR=1 FL=1